MDDLTARLEAAEQVCRFFAQLPPEIRRTDAGKAITLAWMEWYIHHGKAAGADGASDREVVEMAMRFDMTSDLAVLGYLDLSDEERRKTNRRFFGQDELG
jgi:hypothetical protein